MDTNEAIRDDAFISIANILSHYHILKSIGSVYDITHDMAVVLEYINHLESLLKKEDNHENS